MPADYSSTARALSLPISPTQSPSATRPPWARRSGSLQRPTNGLFTTNGGKNWRDQIIDSAEKIQRRVTTAMKEMTVLQRVLAGMALVIAAALGITFLVFTARIFSWLAPRAEKWKALKGGWLILWAFTFLTGFPPIIGYSTCLTTAGFVYGVWEGWAITATATVVGSTCSFILSRTLLQGYVHRLASDTRFAALTLILKHDGIKLLCMIRLCPLPYSLSNGAMSTIETVSPAAYALATALVTPKLLVPVFIGCRLAEIARNGGTMSAGTKVVNYISIIGGAAVGALTGWYIYRRVVARARQLEAEERTSLRQSSAHRNEHTIFSENTEEQAAAATLLRDDDIDFLAEDGPNKSYHDEPSDDEDDVFGAGDGDEEEVIGLHQHKGS